MLMTVTIASQTLLTPRERADMQTLYDRYYVGGTPGDFARDLAGKDFVILLKDAGAVVGFSTQKLCRFDDTPDVFLFSGDTVVDAAYWSRPALAGAFGHLMHFLNARENPERLFWFLISKGPRTYRYLPTFYTRYFPGPDAATTLESRRNFIAQKMFGNCFDPASGVIRFSGAKDRLRPEWTQDTHDDPHTRFFEAANPRWREGDELACLVPLALDNLNRLGRRVIATTHPAWRL